MSEATLADHVATLEAMAMWQMPRERKAIEAVLGRLRDLEQRSLDIDMVSFLERNRLTLEHRVSLSDSIPPWLVRRSWLMKGRTVWSTGRTAREALEKAVELEEESCPR